MSDKAVQQTKMFSARVTLDITLNYLEYVPKDYDPQGTERWPLVLFLHGAGERGNDATLLGYHGLPRLVNEGQEFPFILVSPQCPSGYHWSAPLLLKALGTLLDEIEREYSIDPDRIYATGLSMGGYGSWELALAYPQRFAAIVPICGAAHNLDRISAIRYLPVWAFHGDRDDVVPLKNAEKTVNALKASGGNVKLTVYPGVRHNSWDSAYADPELYRWLLSQQRQRNT